MKAILTMIVGQIQKTATQPDVNSSSTAKMHGAEIALHSAKRKLCTYVEKQKLIHKNADF